MGREEMKGREKRGKWRREDGDESKSKERREDKSLRSVV